MELQTSELRDIVLTLVCSISVVAVHHYFFNSKRLSGPSDEASTEEAQAGSIYAQRLWGMFWLALIPASVGLAFRVHPAPFGLLISDPMPAVVLLVTVLLIVVPIIWLNSQQPSIWSTYPEIRATAWSWHRHLSNALTWGVYLVAYEFLFRGFLLFGLAEHLEMWPAISITTAIYVAAHFGKPLGELLGCVPVGIGFGYVALLSGGIWGPVAAHLLIAVCNDEFCQRYRNSSMSK
jgi:membrane protease YdiL (CAAX protease family)